MIQLALKRCSDNGGPTVHWIHCIMNATKALRCTDYRGLDSKSVYTEGPQPRYFEWSGHSWTAVELNNHSNSYWDQMWYPNYMCEAGGRGQHAPPGKIVALKWMLANKVSFSFWELYIYSTDCPIRVLCYSTWWHIKCGTGVAHLLEYLNLFQSSLVMTDWTMNSGPALIRFMDTT